MAEPPKEGTLGRRRFLQGVVAGAGAAAAAAVGIDRIGGPEKQPAAAGLTQEPTIRSRSWPEKRPDGTIKFTDPIRPEERKFIESQVDSVANGIKELFDTGSLNASGLDVDQLAQEMKTWDDQKLNFWAGHRNYDRHRWEPDLEEFSAPFGDSNTGIWVWYVKNKESGNFQYLNVSMPVDGDGVYRRPDSEIQTTIDELTRLPAKLRPLVKDPKGGSENYSHEKLGFSAYYYPREGDPTGQLVLHPSLSTAERLTADNKLFSLTVRMSGEGYGTTVTLRNPNVLPTLRGTGGGLP